MASTRRSGLGRGLEALIPQGIPDDLGEFAHARVESISPNPQQPRTSFDADSLESLTASVKEIGILQPLVVRVGEADGTFILIAGERRLRAAKEAGLSEVPVVIRAADDQTSLTAALIENVQRQDLSPLEEAAAYDQLLEEFGLTHQDIGDRVGKSRSAVTNSLRLLTLPASIQGLLERGELSAGAARAFLGLEDRAYAEHIAQKAADEGWSVRQVEEAVRDRQNVEPAERGAVPASTSRELRPAAISELEQRLAEQLETKVNIKYRNNKGSVIIRYESLEDLERIYRVFY